MNSPFNSPLEVGIRVLTILVESFPVPLDMNRLVLLDYGLLHSAELGGTESIHPPVPIHVGELGVRRQQIRAGLQVLIRAQLAEMAAKPKGIEFWAHENSESFLKLFESKYLNSLKVQAGWVVEELGSLEDNILRDKMKLISSNWDEEFSIAQDLKENGK